MEGSTTLLDLGSMARLQLKHSMWSMTAMNLAILNTRFFVHQQMSHTPQFPALISTFMNPLICVIDRGIVLSKTAYLDTRLHEPINQRLGQSKLSLNRDRS